MQLPVVGRRLIFVGGKGGVGKTTTAAATALHLADGGKRCLVVSTDPAHSLGDVFKTEIGDRPRALAPGLLGLEIDPDAQADTYLAGVKQSMRQLVHPEMYHEVDRQVELARTSPGAVEAAMLERVAELMTDEGLRQDVIIFDTAPTGQTIRLLSLPEIMTAWTEGLIRHRERSDKLGEVLGRVSGAARRKRGDDLSRFDQHSDEPADPRFAQVRETLLRRRRTFQRARRLLLDPEVTAFVLVLIPERLPVLETAKAVQALSRFEIPVSALVVNRILPEGPLGPFLEERRDQERHYLARIGEEFGGLPQIRVPLFARDVGGLEALREVARHLFGGAALPGH